MESIYMEMPLLGLLVNGVYARGDAVPNDRDNPVWREYLEFLKRGGEPLPFDPTMEWTDGRWVENRARKAERFATLKSAQIEKMRIACETALVAGFISSALGSARTYPSQDADQRNFLNAALGAEGQSPSWSTPLWSSDEEGWSLTDHTAAQVQQVNADWLAHRVAAQQKYADLIARINAATSIAEVQAIDW
ncbi:MULTISPECIES: DUF4376 domain-containing protein [Ralstonia]|uniref:DUF4376 domain-containing protein n=1 Tax=Ralstonia edaphi TaxID=3058599 RepID=A0AB72X406_9RALS|nr:hypothetical protein [Ralstonia sp. LMG 6871]CAJ0742439.1 hypothetical protein R16034_03140 [Ralstonia sp. LMG 6871]